MGSGVAPNLLPGTLDLLILRTLLRGPTHGYGIAQHVRSVSDEVLQIGESSLYPALQRLLLNGWVKAEWGVSENNRRARYYRLTPAGRKRLVAERQEFDQVVVAIQKILDATEGIATPACRRGLSARQSPAPWSSLLVADSWSPVPANDSRSLDPGALPWLLVPGSRLSALPPAQA